MRAPRLQAARDTVHRVTLLHPYGHVNHAGSRKPLNSTSAPGLPHLRHPPVRIVGVMDLLAQMVRHFCEPKLRVVRVRHRVSLAVCHSSFDHLRQLPQRPVSRLQSIAAQHPIYWSRHIFRPFGVSSNHITENMSHHVPISITIGTHQY
jgi:hypothetical protein